MGLEKILCKGKQKSNKTDTLTNYMGIFGSFIFVASFMAGIYSVLLANMDRNNTLLQEAATLGFTMSYLSSLLSVYFIDCYLNR